MSDEAARVFEILGHIASLGLTGDIKLVVAPTVIRPGHDGMWRAVVAKQDDKNIKIAFLRNPE